MILKEQLNRKVLIEITHHVRYVYMSIKLFIRLHFETKNY